MDSWTELMLQNIFHYVGEFFWEFSCWAITQLSWVNYVNRLVLHPNNKSEMFLKEPKWLQHWPITPGLFLAVPKKKKMGRCCHHQARCGLVQYPRMRRCQPLGREPTTKSKKFFSLRTSSSKYIVPHRNEATRGGRVGRHRRTSRLFFLWRQTIQCRTDHQSEHTLLYF